MNLKDNIVSSSPFHGVEKMQGLQDRFQLYFVLCTVVPQVQSMLPEIKLLCNFYCCFPSTIYASWNICTLYFVLLLSKYNLAINAVWKICVFSLYYCFLSISMQRFKGTLVYRTYHLENTFSLSFHVSFT